MEAFIPAARVLGVGEYDMEMAEGRAKPRYLDIYSPESGQVRLSVHRDCPPLDGIEFGAMLDLRCELANSERVVRGEDRDRSMKSVRVVVREFTKTAEKNGRASRETVAAVA